MIKLSSVTEENWMDVAELSVAEEQKRFLAPAIGILARGYVYRNCNGRVFVIENEEPGASCGTTESCNPDESTAASEESTIVGVALVREFTDEPLGYDLQQFMIDARYQGKGYGAEALRLILEELHRENHYDHVEVCVKKDDTAAVRLYEKLGFVDSGYVDEDLPDCVNLICYLS